MNKAKKIIWEFIQSKVITEITQRIIIFHDALVERGQIQSPPRPADPQENN